MAIRIGHMKITFTSQGILWAVWIKALFHEVCPEMVNIRNFAISEPNSKNRASKVLLLPMLVQSDRN
jgi:hypothetical protein